MAFDIKKKYNSGSVFTPISEGVHIAHITRAVVGESSNGNPMLTVEYTVLTPKDDKGKKFRDKIVLVDEWYGYGKISKLCVAVDPNMVGAAQDPENGFDPHNQASVFKHLIGGLITIRTKHKAATNRAGEARTYVEINDRRDAPGWEPVKPEHLTRLFNELGRKPELPQNAYTDFDGTPIIADDSDLFGAETGFSADDFPF